MIIFHGFRLYGKVDHVPGLFHVATMFFHVQFLPMVPWQSVLVLEGRKAGGKPAMMPIRLSGKSILIGWLRLALVLGAGIAGFMALINIDGPDKHTIPFLLAVSVGCCIALWMSYRVFRAKPLRALQLATQVGIAPEVVARHFADRLSDAELDELAQAARASDEPAPEQYQGSDG
ncbi:MAG TPA: hypothetical protein VK395_26340 [Gemmataceae bacterium]|nr:hypothetical protein [Gemmataceae bacterium]